MYLAEALANYSIKGKGKIVFRNGLSLNRLAFVMWEQASFSGIDVSVLSKVLNGKRLFTPYQLSVFCKVLNLKRADREYLFYCLHKDQCLKGGVNLNMPFVLSSDSRLFVEKVVRQADVLFQAGKWKDLYNLSSVLQTYLHGHTSTIYRHNPEDPLITTYKKVLYLRVKSIVGIAPQSTVMRETKTAIRALRQYPNSAFGGLLASYAASFEASAYRVLGIFPTHRNAAFDPKTAIMSRRLAIKAIQALSPTDPEYLASLRNIIDSSIALEERGVFLEYLKISLQIMFMQPAENFLFTMQLAATVGKGMAVFKIGNPFALKEKMEKYFNRNLIGARIFELADLKIELEIYVALGTAKDSRIEQKIQRALTLAEEESPRYKVVINRLAQQL